VDPTGILNMPLVGRLKAEGLTRDELQVQLTAALRTYIREPEVVINVTSTRAMSISILGGVRNPGTHQFRGTKNLLEMISTAGGP
jgi:polysaccharide export outer membrane protein